MSSPLQQVLDQLVSEGAAGVLAEFRDPGGTHRLSSGFAELGGPLPIDPAGWFRIGSVTKVFTAAVILQLAGENSLDLDDPIRRWLPDLPDVTVRQLLNHTSGLYNYTRDLTTDGILRDRFRQWTPREAVEQALRRGPDFPAGTSRAYNNTAYVLLGMLIEEITGLPYDVTVEQRLLHPLGLGGSPARLPEPHAHGYLLADGKPVDITDCDPSHAGAASGLISTAANLNDFFAALLTGPLLSPASRRQLLTTIPTGTPGVDGGLGITRYTLPGGTVVWGKDGGFHGYRTWSFHTPDATRQLTISLTFGTATGPTTPTSSPESPRSSPQTTRRRRPTAGNPVSAAVFRTRLPCTGRCSRPESPRSRCGRKGPAPRPGPAGC